MAMAPEFQHTLVIGGTGMLREATIALARRSQLLTAASHSRNALRDLGQALAGTPCERRLISLDWNQPEEFLASLKRHVEASGTPRLAVAWLHDPQLGTAVANAITGQGLPCDFFQVFGIDAADPARPPAVEPEGGMNTSVHYHQIILGFEKTADGSRWLTHEEISAGVLEGIAQRASLHTVGQVAPWEERPRSNPSEVRKG
jgi:hypothetical protein